MSDDTPRPHHETQPVRPEGGRVLPPAPPADPVPVAAPPAARRGFRERLGVLRRSDGSRTFGLAALIASALAGIIVGGLGLSGIQAVGDDHGEQGRGGWTQQGGPVGGGPDGDVAGQDGRGPVFGGPGGFPGGGPGGVPGQSTTPQDDDGSNS